MATPEEPRLDLAISVLPNELIRALNHIFSHGLSGTALVGGSAISGFYAGHRRSDDLDLFAPTRDAQRQTVRAARRLAEVGIEEVQVYQNIPDFFNANFRIGDYSFKLQVVLDEALHSVATFHDIAHNIRVASLDTLFSMKVAALVGRCSEKDLYDVIWLLAHRFPQCEHAEFLERGYLMDRGVNGETMLMSLTGANLVLEDCDFALDPRLSKQVVHSQITSFRDGLAKGLSLFLHSRSAPSLPMIARQILLLRPESAASLLNAAPQVGDPDLDTSSSDHGDARDPTIKHRFCL